MIWFGWVLWHINHCRLFNAKFSLYIYIKYIRFGLVGFYGISTIVSYLIPHPFYTSLLQIYDFVWLCFYGISTIVGYLLPNPLYTSVSHIKFGLTVKSCIQSTRWVQGEGSTSLQRCNQCIFQP